MSQRYSNAHAAASLETRPGHRWLTAFSCLTSPRRNAPASTPSHASLCATAERQAPAPRPALVVEQNLNPARALPPPFYGSTSRQPRHLTTAL
ncbi:hypothetical protein JCM16814_30870 [Desulfobaculum senezii]